jgi:hypothetical protein
MQNTLGGSGGSRGIEQEERIFRVYVGRSTVRASLGEFVVPPEVTTNGKWNLCACATKDKNVFHRGSVLQSLIYNTLGSNALTTTTTLISGEDNTCTSIVDTVTKRIGRETSKDNRVNGTNAGTGQHGIDGFRYHGHVDGNIITLANIKGLEHIGNTGYFLE